MEISLETIFIIVFTLGLLILSGAFLVLLFLFFKQKDKLENIAKSAEQINSISTNLSTNMMFFSKELGEVKTSSAQIYNLKKEISETLTTQEKKLQPLNLGVEHLLNYFGGLKAQAGKVGELTFELLVEKLPPGQLAKNITFENQSRLEFLLKVGEDWVPVDSKFSGKPKVYLKKAIEDVSTKYLDQKIIRVQSETGCEETANQKRSATYGIIFFPSDEALFEVYQQEELRALMLAKRVWAVSPSNMYWQLFFLNWVDAQARRSEKSHELIRSLSMGLKEVDSSVKFLDLFEKQYGQSKLNIEKAKKSLSKAKKHLSSQGDLQGTQGGSQGESLTSEKPEQPSL